jgi:acetylornithine deacetylase/succinyl-diaminopimelate desuccinylase-like protein
VYTINTAEKGLLWFKVKVKGTPGHGSMPEAADNPIMRMNRVIDKLGNYYAKVQLVPIVKKFILEIAAEDPTVSEQLTRIIINPDASDQLLDELEKKAPTITDEIRPRLRMTITPTIVHGGAKENVIPSGCEAVFDCRVLPGQSTAQAMDIVKDLLRDVGLQNLSFETVQAQEPSESTMDTPLFSTITSVLKDFEPNCGVAPLLMAGGTDSRFFRKRGSVCYGFHPLHSETGWGAKVTRREHGIDERISVENLVFGASVLYETIKKFMT